MTLFTPKTDVKCPAPGNWALLVARKREWEDNKSRKSRARTRENFFPRAGLIFPLNSTGFKEEPGQPLSRILSTVWWMREKIKWSKCLFSQLELESNLGDESARINILEGFLKPTCRSKEPACCADFFQRVARIAFHSLQVKHSATWPNPPVKGIQSAGWFRTTAQLLEAAAFRATRL